MIRSSLPQHLHRLYFIKQENGKYWIDEKLYVAYEEEKKKLLMIVGIILLIVVIAGVVAVLVGLA